MKNDDINKELKENAPLLSELDKTKEGYSVPFNYFEGLPEQIMDQVIPQSTPVEAPSESRPSLLDWLAGFLQPRYAMALASMVGLLMVGGYFWNGATNDLSNPDLLAASISAEDVQLYVQENIDEFALELLAEDGTVELDMNELIDLNESDLQDYIDDVILDDLDDEDLL